MFVVHRIDDLEIDKSRLKLGNLVVHRIDDLEIKN